MKSHSAPLSEKSRLISLDIIRGLALLGILLANSIHFQFGLFPDAELHHLYPLGIFDRFAEMFILLFAQASFYTLFSFLFGYSMNLLKDRLKKRDLNFGAVYWRRMVILLIIGYLHGKFIWDGDILFLYALTAFPFFFFLKLKARGLLIWSALLLLIMASSATIDDDSATTEIDEQLYQYSIHEKDVLSSGSYLDTVAFRLHADPLGMGLLGDIMIHVSGMISVLGMFLLGAFVARKKWLEDIDTHKLLIKKVWWITLIIGFSCKLAYVINNSTQNEMIHTTIGGPFTAIFYVASVALLTTNKNGRKLMLPLANVGRLSLTNYLMQSIVFTTIFYGYGIGLFNRIGILSGTILCLLFFIVQIALSKWWLARFHFGPCEWVWRIGTYMKLQKLRR